SLKSWSDMGYLDQDAQLPKKAPLGPEQAPTRRGHSPGTTVSETPPPAHPLSSSAAGNIASKAVPLGGASAAPFAGMYDGSPSAAKPAAKSDAFSSPFASVFLTGITDEADTARSASQHVTGHDSSVALYEGRSPTGDAKQDPNARAADLKSSD